MEKVHLLKEIEDLRHQLYSISRDRELVDPAVIRMSQELDILLNLYYRTCLMRECRRAG